LTAAAERAWLARVASALGLTLSDVQVDRLIGFIDLLERWNATYNLSAVRERAEMFDQHLADCLAVVPALLHRAGRGRLLDVGSGGGLPGVVVAVALPAWDVTCIDAVGKKAAFMRQVAGVLGLANLHVRHGRVEAPEALRFGPYDVITARAFASLAELVRLTGRQLAPEGVWMAMKARDPVAERAALPSWVEVFHVEHLSVPGVTAPRRLVWMRRRSSVESPASTAAARPGTDGSR
jgi:16S rRNA (guanine527-N7)-methyltransferase